MKPNLSTITSQSTVFNCNYPISFITGQCNNTPAINKLVQNYHFFHIASLCHLVVVKTPVYSTRFAIVIQIEGEKLVLFALLNDSACQTRVKLIWQGGQFMSFLSKGGLQRKQLVGTQPNPVSNSTSNRFSLPIFFSLFFRQADFCPVVSVVHHRIYSVAICIIASDNCNFHQVAILSRNLMAIKGFNSFKLDSDNEM